MNTLRTFIAIELDDELRDNLGRLQARLRERVSPGSVRWVRPDGIHLTLKFLGDTPLAKVEEVQAALAQAAADVGPFAFTVAGVGCFPNARSPRVVWVGLQELSGALVRLRDAVETQVAPLGFPTENRPFRPHLTIGRVQRRASKSEVREIGEVVTTSSIGTVDEMTVTVVSYIKSDLKPSGAVYTTLFEAKLGGA
ncbi:MAG TPA: RNA 2',3'-cyclic phosphodiesterase [Anaerolineae bacterium]|nr:RNA 2',3'-cyclic phosphodiesterase [Anaerolineae bacterium]